MCKTTRTEHERENGRSFLIWYDTRSQQVKSSFVFFIVSYRYSPFQTSWMLREANVPESARIRSKSGRNLMAEMSLWTDQNTSATKRGMIYVFDLLGSSSIRYFLLGSQQRKQMLFAYNAYVSYRLLSASITETTASNSRQFISHQRFRTFFNIAHR